MEKQMMFRAAVYGFGKLVSRGDAPESVTYWRTWEDAKAYWASQGFSGLTASSSKLYGADDARVELKWCER